MLLALLLTIAKQGRAFSFLSFQDTIFAVRKRNGWGTPARLTEFPLDEIELVGLGLSSVRARCPAMVEGWDAKAACFDIACEDYDHVMGWFVEPRYPRQLRRRPDANGQSQALARKVFKDRRIVVTSLKDVETYSVDLGGDGRDEMLVDVSGIAAGHSYGLVFMSSQSGQTQTLTCVQDGWPRVLCVADLDSDNGLEVIVGGTTTAGKCISMWKYDKGVLKRLTDYPAAP